MLLFFFSHTARNSLKTVSQPLKESKNSSSRGQTVFLWLFLTPLRFCGPIGVAESWFVSHLPSDHQFCNDYTGSRSKNSQTRKKWNNWLLAAYYTWLRGEGTKKLVLSSDCTWSSNLRAVQREQCHERQSAVVGSKQSVEPLLKEKDKEPSTEKPAKTETQKSETVYTYIYNYSFFFSLGFELSSFKVGGLGPLERTSKTYLKKGKEQRKIKAYRCLNRRHFKDINNLKS